MKISIVWYNEILVQQVVYKISWDVLPVLNMTEAFNCEVLEGVWQWTLENNVIFVQVHSFGR